MKELTVYKESLDACVKTHNVLFDSKLDTLSTTMLTLATKEVKFRGLRSTVSLLKALYNELTRFALGYKIVPMTDKWIKRDGDLFPILLKHFKPLLQQESMEKRRHILSILRCYESITLKPVPDLSSVVDSSNGHANYAKFRQDFRKFCRYSRFAASIKVSFNKAFFDQQVEHIKGNDDYHYSSKRGISGPTCLTAGLQSKAITGDIREELVKFNLLYSRVPFAGVLDSNREYHKGKVNDLYTDKTVDNDKLETCLGRITFVPDKGGKTRLVAIGNYWVQDSLKLLHKTAYSTLKRIPQDGTYKQESRFDTILKESSKRGVWSFDLSKATDRFPLGPQVDVLTSLNVDLGKSWNRILGMLEFEYEGSMYKYKVGQPMGLYASWAMFALTHHYIIQYCAFKEGKTFPFEKYAVLGDDVAVWDIDVARRYRDLINKLDVQINDSKSYTPLRGSENKPGVAEFAKRVSYRGKEMSPISPELCRIAWRNVVEFPTFFNTLKQRGYDLETVPVSRIAKANQLSKNSLELLCCEFHILSMMTGASFEGIQPYLPIGFEKEIDRRSLVNVRIDNLADQVTALIKVQKTLRTDAKGALNLALLDFIPDNHYFLKIIDTRIRQVKDVYREIVRIFDMENPEIVDLEIDISDIEYVPVITVADLIKPRKGSKSRLSMRSEFIGYLAKEARDAVALSSAEPV